MRNSEKADVHKDEVGSDCTAVEAREEHRETPMLGMVIDHHSEQREKVATRIDGESTVDAITIAVDGNQDEQKLVEGQVKTRPTRDMSLDLFRGIVMVLMVLDHTLMPYLPLAGMHKTPGEHWDEISDVENTTGYDKDGYAIFYFVVRALITNTVAPGFCILMGMGLQLMIDSRLKLKWPSLQIIKYLVVRGFVIAVPMNFLIVLQRGIGGFMFMQIEVNNCILFALGASLALASLIVVPLRTNNFIISWRLDTLFCALAGVIFLVVEQVIVDEHMKSRPTPTVLSTSFILPGRADGWKINYSILPVLAVTLLGASFGSIFKTVGSEHHTKWRKVAFPMMLSVIFFALFGAVRASDSWGNTNSIQAQLDTGEVYWEAFFRTTKYPFSIAAALYACGFNLLLLSLCALLDLSGGISRGRWLVKLPLELGGASLIGYVFHLWTVMILSFVVLGGIWAAAPSPPESETTNPVVHWIGKGGLLLVFMVVIFPLVLMSTYLVCKRFGAFKRGTAPDSLWRLL